VFEKAKRPGEGSSAGAPPVRSTIVNLVLGRNAGEAAVVA